VGGALHPRGNKPSYIRGFTGNGLARALYCRAVACGHPDYEGLLGNWFPVPRAIPPPFDSGKNRSGPQTLEWERFGGTFHKPV